MKKLLACLLLLVLLAACKAAPALPGVWVNAGQYRPGQDFVETMTLRPDGTVTVHLEYQGSDYATLEGSWSAEGGVLAVDFTDPDVRDRTYTYALTDTALTLTGDGKSVLYTRQN